MPFVRALYCVDARYRPLRGSSAAALGCPTGGSRKQFVQDNPGLFYATGFAHHPYYFHHSPDTSAPDPDYVPISDLSRLERALDRIFSSYGVHRQIPLYLTEYGYQTNPPNPYQVVTPAEQAPYLNESDYMAWRDPRVRSVAQFLLRDSGPDNRYSPANPSYWDTFQTGLEYVTGKRKPAYTAYRVPIWIPSTHVKRGKRLFVWGEVRPAWNINRAPVMVQWRGTRGGFRTIATIRTGSHGYLVAHVRLMASGTIRIAWLAPTGALQSSRGVSVRVG